jgi:energy-coupling factor transporter ATP-binding protein EcfA2
LIDAEVPQQEHSARIDQALAEMELTPFADQRISSLSGGQGQRVAIARMLARDVDLVIADEPTANLDPGLRAVVMDLLRRMSQHVPVIVVTHDAAVAESCDRTIILQATSAHSDALVVAGPAKARPHRIRVATVGIAVIGAAAFATAAYVIALHQKGSPSVTGTTTTTVAVSSLPSGVTTCGAPPLPSDPGTWPDNAPRGALFAIWVYQRNPRVSAVQIPVSQITGTLDPCNNHWVVADVNYPAAEGGPATAMAYGAGGNWRGIYLGDGYDLWQVVPRAVYHDIFSCQMPKNPPARCL